MVAFECLLRAPGRLVVLPAARPALCSAEANCGALLSYRAMKACMHVWRSLAILLLLSLHRRSTGGLRRRE